MIHSSVGRALPVAALIVICTLAAAPVPAAVLTVGPNGTYATIQQAIDAAVVGDDNELRIQGTHTYVENLSVSASFSSGTLALVGGWDSTFTNQIFAPVDTVVDGNQAGRVLDVFGVAGHVVVDNLTLTNGLSSGPGAGARVDPAGSASVTLSKVRIEANTSTTSSGSQGGGLSVELVDDQRLELLDVRITDNSVITTGGGFAGGGGAAIRAIQSSSFLIDGCEIDFNLAQSASGQAKAGGLWIDTSDNAQGEILDCSITNNSAVGADVPTSGADFRAIGFASLNVERSAVGLNTATGGGTPVQLRANNGDDASFRISDSIAGVGDHGGVVCGGDNSTTVNLVNLTVVDNSGTGLQVDRYGTATVTLHNTISFGNGTDLLTGSGVDTGSNLIGVDPHFVNPAQLDYRLQIGSPAVDAGDNAPPGGLGASDLDGNPRVVGGTVDIGCYEWTTEIFSDGFESGDTAAWSASVP
jgi:hypothetical protein